MQLLLRLGTRAPRLPQLAAATRAAARTRAFTASPSARYARRAPHRSSAVPPTGRFRQRDTIASISHRGEIDYDALLEEKLTQHAEALSDVTDEQLAYWDSEGFAKLLSQYPAVALNIRVPPAPPAAEADVDDEAAVDLAVELYVAAYPAGALQSPDAQERFAEGLVVGLVDEVVPVIKEGLRVGWLAPVDKKVATILDSGA